jgi:hypothetical protein
MMTAGPSSQSNSELTPGCLLRCHKNVLVRELRQGTCRTGFAEKGTLFLVLAVTGVSYDDSKHVFVQGLTVAHVGWCMIDKVSKYWTIEQTA